MIDLLSLWRKPPVDPTAIATSALPASPQTDGIKTIVDEVLDVALAATITRPIIHATLYGAKVLLDALWPAIFPAATAKLAAKGIKV